MFSITRRFLLVVIPIYSVVVMLSSIRVTNRKFAEDAATATTAANNHHLVQFPFWKKDNNGNNAMMMTRSTNVRAGSHESNNSTNPTTTKTLALLTPPGMIGGYRNQFLRFVAMVWYAQQQDINQLLLPSILWSTTYRSAHDERQFFPVPMDLLFDVEYWNTFSPHVPRLVRPIHNVNTKTNPSTRPSPGPTSDCWEPLNTAYGQNEMHRRRTLLSDEAFNNSLLSSSGAKKQKTFFDSPMTNEIMERSGFLRPIVNETLDYFAGKRTEKPRKVNLFPLVQHCTNPYVIGGGRGAGVLWNMWTTKMQKAVPEGGTNNDVKNVNNNKSSRTTTMQHLKAIENSHLISTVTQALRPHPKWRNVAHECIRYHLSSPSQQEEEEEEEEEGVPTNVLPYLALHGRVEVDMMDHKCGRDMEKNLTTIFGMVDSFVDNYNQQAERNGSNSTKLHGTFVAVSRNSMRLPTKNKATQALSTQNWDVLNSRSSIIGDSVSKMNTVFDARESPKPGVPVFECGEVWMDRWYNTQSEVPEDFYGSIVPSILNFYTATHATVFVGVDKSSWSTDVWTTRYLLGKGQANFRYIKDHGITPVANGGMPPSHKNC